ncbi:MAG: hypothetical protein ABR549_16525 [Mycobacteriales bacterium]
MSKRSTDRTTRPHRACAVCGAKLSSYNDNETCWAHTVELPWKGPNTKPR